ncbi:TetR/AcrR family transcriptional regulator [Nonomuraea sp. NPDC051191]|uniref:TetR/AcrR family transcriptional regulator n=1 Tax=Nonomuraea sp. NPDC051191 TaxID=3364372 RepID=UPI0037BC5F0C
MIVRSLTLRGKRTRATLLAAGREAFEEHGYDAVRIDDVCARAGVSHGTFYTYFDSKEALFGEVAQAVVGEMFAASAVGAAAPDDPYARVEAANRLYLRAWAANSRLVRMVEHAADADPGSGGCCWSCARRSSGAAPTGCAAFRNRAWPTPRSTRG